VAPVLSWPASARLGADHVIFRADTNVLIVVCANKLATPWKSLLRIALILPRFLDTGRTQNLRVGVCELKEFASNSGKRD